MKLLQSFIKRNLFWIIVVLALCGSHLFYLYLVNIPLHDIGYSALLDLCLIGVFGTVNYIRYRRKTARMEELLNEPVSSQIELPEPEDAIEHIYSQLFENANISRQMAVNTAGRQQSEMKEYYSRWVHQVKTPIAALQLLLQVHRNELEELAEKLPFSEEPGKHDPCNLQNVSDMEEELFCIEQYVNMALQYQRVNGTGNDFVLEEISLDAAIREVIRKYARTMIRKKLCIQYEGTQQMVLSDEKWITFVVGQVLSNAIKYSASGTIHMEVTKEANWCYIKITDQGIGIRQEDIPRVFEQGFTGYNGHADKKSTGIGLYLCKQVLNKLGHTIRIESEVGKGTTVWIGFSTIKREAMD